MSHQLAYRVPVSSRAMAAATALVCFVAPLPAYAVTAEDVVRYATSPAAAYAGMGCAAGAVAGGLVAWLGCRGARRSLEAEVQEAMDVALDASDAVRHLSARVARLARALDEQERKAAEEPSEVMPEAQGASQGTEAASGESSEYDADRAADARGALAVVEGALADVGEVAPSEKKTMAAGVATVDAREEASEKPSLRQRIGTGRMAALPVIDRGASREGPSTFGARMDAQPSQGPGHDVAALGGAERAALIASRVPSIDEELFPDMRDVRRDGGEDDFEAAMRAMDDTMANIMSDSWPPSERVAAEPFDASSYVDRLVQEELEINRRGAGRRFSREHLRVFEGTGDLSTVRRSQRKAPRHLSRMSQEA